jgi:hypothetical protein
MLVGCIFTVAPSFFPDFSLSVQAMRPSSTMVTTLATSRAAFTFLGLGKRSILLLKAWCRGGRPTIAVPLPLCPFFAVSDSFGVGGAPQKDSSVHSVPSDVVNQSFRDVETTLPGPHQQGLEPVAEYSIVPKQGHAPHSVTLVCFRCFCLCFLMCLVHCGCLQAAGNKSTFNFNSAVLLFRSRH